MSLNSYSPIHPVLDLQMEFIKIKVTISLLEVVLGLLPPLHPVLDLQIGVVGLWYSCSDLLEYQDSLV